MLEQCSVLHKNLKWTELNLVKSVWILSTTSKFTDLATKQRTSASAVIRETKVHTRTCSIRWSQHRFKPEGLVCHLIRQLYLGLALLRLLALKGCRASLPRWRNNPWDLVGQRHLVAPVIYTDVCLARCRCRGASVQSLQHNLFIGYYLESRSTYDLFPAYVMISWRKFWNIGCIFVLNR